MGLGGTLESTEGGISPKDEPGEWECADSRKRFLVFGFKWQLEGVHGLEGMAYMAGDTWAGGFACYGGLHKGPAGGCGGEELELLFEEFAVISYLGGLSVYCKLLLERAGYKTNK